MATAINLSQSFAEQPALSRQERLLPHLALGILFVGMAVVQCAVSMLGLTKNGVGGVLDVMLLMCLVLTVPVGIWARRYGVWASEILTVDLLLVANTFAGVPGVLLNSPDDLLPPVGYTIALALRNFVLFILLPRCAVMYLRRFDRLVIGWMLGGASLVTLGSLYMAIVRHIALGAAERLHGGGWLHMNLTGLFAAAVIIGVAMASFAPTWFRLAMGLIGFYVLLLTQSRSAMLAVMVTLIVYTVVANYRRSVRVFLWSLLLGAVAILVIPPILPSIMESPAVIRMIRRSTAGSLRENSVMARELKIENSVNRLADSPINALFGFGFKGEDTYLENGLVSLANETGLLGVFAYLAFCGVMFVCAISLLRRHRDEPSQALACCVIALTTFLFARSLGERSHGFQGSDIVGNAWLLLCGYLIVYRSLLARQAAAGRYAEEYEEDESAADEDETGWGEQALPA